MTPIPENKFNQYLPAQLAWRYKAVPQMFEKGMLTVLVDENSWKKEHIGELSFLVGYEIEVVSAGSEHIAQLLNAGYRKNVFGSKNKVEINVAGDDFLSKVITEAKELNSSDIHVEIYSDKCRIRFRIDGLLIERYVMTKESYLAFVNKIKIKARLDIAEKRMPQDGRILVNEEGSKLDMRVSVLPSLYGEKIVLRLLHNDVSGIDLESLGFSELQLNSYVKALKKLTGIILISGPTGSGKTTTLYASLKMLNDSVRNILTIEDPVEYTLDGVNQVQLKENIGLGYASALKAFLRQDPDIIMLGEIRDNETANMAIRAALTGHLVLSTIHTNSAWGIVSRLVDMGVPPYLLAATLNIAVAQRLVRKLCDKCKQVSHFTPDSLIAPLDKYFQGGDIHNISVGCNDCFFTGYNGRKAIYEVIPIDASLGQYIKDARNVNDDFWQKRNVTNLVDSAIYLVKSGMTSVEEVYPILLNY